MSMFTRLGLPDRNAAQAERLAELENLASQVTHGLRHFVRAGEALAQIRDKQLYRLTHESFDAFCHARWNMTERHALRLIEASQVVQNLGPMGQNVTSERQARALAPLAPDQQREVMAEAAADGTPTLAKIKAAAERRTPRKRKRSKPRPIRVKVPQGIVIIERKSADLDPIEMLRQAAEKLSAEKRTEAA